MHPVTSTSPAAVALLDKAVWEYTRLAGDPVGHLHAALRADGTIVGAHIMNVALHVLSTGADGSHRGVSASMAAIRSAMDTGRVHTERERRLAGAVEALVCGQWRLAASIFEQQLSASPCDLLTLRLSHDVYFFLGESRNLRDSVARVWPAWDPSMPGYGQVAGMLAFGHEECGAYAQAEELAMTAVNMDPSDAWAIHAAVHVHEMCGRREEGKRLLREMEEHWKEANLFDAHLHWHAALLSLEDGAIGYRSASWQYAEGLGGEERDHALALVDATALLWRMELLHGEYEVPVAWQGRATSVTGSMALRLHPRLPPLECPPPHVEVGVVAMRKAMSSEVRRGEEGGGDGAAERPSHEQQRGSGGVVDGERDGGRSGSGSSSGGGGGFFSSLFGSGRGGEEDPKEGRLSRPVQTSSPASGEGAPSERGAPSPPPTPVHFALQTRWEEVADRWEPFLRLEGGGHGGGSSGEEGVEGGPPARLYAYNDVHMVMALGWAAKAAGKRQAAAAAVGAADVAAAAGAASGRYAAQLEGVLQSMRRDAKRASARVPPPLATLPSPALSGVLLGVYSTPVSGTGAPSSAISLTAWASHDNMAVNAIVGASLAEGIASFIAGDCGTALQLLVRTRSRWHLIGGSHAQRDMFEQTLLHAAVGAGDLPTALALARERSTLRGSSAQAWYILGSLYEWAAAVSSSAPSAEAARLLQSVCAPGQDTGPSELSSRAMDFRNRAYVLGINQGQGF